MRLIHASSLIARAARVAAEQAVSTRARKQCHTVGALAIFYFTTTRLAKFVACAFCAAVIAVRYLVAPVHKTAMSPRPLVKARHRAATCFVPGSVTFHYMRLYMRLSFASSRKRASCANGNCSEFSRCKRNVSKLLATDLRDLKLCLPLHFVHLIRKYSRIFTKDVCKFCFFKLFFIQGRLSFERGT